MRLRLLLSPGKYNVHRWYQAETGRYTRMDPAWTAFSTLRSDSNQYIYAGQSPTVLVDPLRCTT